MAALLLDTPSRVLRRVQQYEDMELPSLPSFQHDLDDMDSDHSIVSDSYAITKAHEPSLTSNGDSSSTAVPGPIPRPFRSPALSSSATVKPVTSPVRYSETTFPTIPYSDTLESSSAYLDQSQSVRHPDASQRADSDHGDSSERLFPPSAGQEFGSRSEIPLYSYDPSYESEIADTPIPRHLGRANLSGSSDRPRIPSLSRSEISVTDTEASTPEGRGRVLDPSVVGDDIDTLGSMTHNYDLEETEEDVSGAPNFDSPAKTASPSSQATATPVAIRYMDSPSTAARAAATPFGAGAYGGPLRDVTPSHRNGTPTTPKSTLVPSSDGLKTPRPPLNDAERRKSHVLSVLASASAPRIRPRGTPHHRLRQVSMAPEGSSIAEESDATSVTQHTERTQNDSFVSIASSDDLMTDRRGSRLHRLQRGNTSVPNILLTNTNTPGVSLNLDGRPDAIKVQKHLNLMNKQLLEGNTELAREAEEWREECNRLQSLIQEAGIEVEVDEDGAIIGIPGQRRRNLKPRDDSLELPSIDTSTLNERLRDMESELQEREETIASLHQRLNDPSQDGHELIALRDKLVASERAYVDLQAGFAKKTEEHASQFTEICSAFEQQVKTLQDELAASKGQLASLCSNAVVDTAQRPTVSAEREEELMAKITALTGTLEDERSRNSHTEADADQQLSASREEVAGLQAQLARAKEEHSLSAATQNQQISQLTAAKASLEAEIQQAEAQSKEQDIVVQEQKSRITNLLDTLARLETQIGTGTTNEQDLEHQVEELQADNEAIRLALAEKDAEIIALQKQRDISRQEIEFGDDGGSHGDATSNSMVIALEDELGEAYREIGRLRHELESAPLRKSTLESRDARIKALETEKIALAERLQSRSVSTPARWGTDSIKTSTPLVHKALSSLMMPRTPGPMKEFSWLQSTIGDANEPMLRVQIEHLQQELELANSQLDRNFGRLEEAGLGAVGLREKLALANDKIAKLEAELRAFARENKTYAASVDVGRTKNATLEEALASVNQQMTILKADMRAEKDRLQDETKRLRALVADIQAKSDHEIDGIGARMVTLQRELDDAVQDGETRVGRLRKERDELQRTLAEAHASADRDRLELAKENRRLKESSASADQHTAAVRGLEERLRDEKRGAEELRETIRQRTQALRAAERAADELRNQRSQVAFELALFNEDLGIQQKECAKFGAELEALRKTQVDRAASHKKALADTEGELGWTRERLNTAMKDVEHAQRRCLHLEKQIAAHDTESRDMSLEQKQKFKSQTRVLSAQIQYLKAKYAREATFRNALSLQKKFLILLIGGKSRNEQVALREIASMGYELPSSARPRRTLKGVALAVVATIRARRLAQQWHMASEQRSVVVDRRVSRS
ncbi:Pericentrin [Vanrija pseudolonga]|uniref:Pericentrin n=1 Tax=Vanrija pseudolonga TaxID=143232 RepID=A0AAF0YB44_9TREE|nr:Pericentrin [Vanrija pseudolonga]